MTWTAEALCRDYEPMFFHDPKNYTAAREVCLTCPVSTECAAHRVFVEELLNGPAVGVWAGVLWVEDTSSNRAREASLV